jgi:hypothetical protein
VRLPTGLRPGPIAPASRAPGVHNKQINRMFEEKPQRSAKNMHLYATVLKESGPSPAWTVVPTTAMPHAWQRQVNHH